ncbi:MAG: shikimate dehydrogenase [Rectinemataceae bacterium]
MSSNPGICLCLTGRSIEEDLRILDLYRGQVDLVEVRADYLAPEEMLHLRSFPERAGLPSILTVRRKCDGGCFEGGEGVRLVMLAKGLTHARADSMANFAYVDLESDFHVPAIEEVCRIFGTKIIRSTHVFSPGSKDLNAIWATVAADQNEIPKLVITCDGSEDFAKFLQWSISLPPGERILIGTGVYGFPTRILAHKIGSLFVYASALSAGYAAAAPGQIDPEQLIDVYHFRALSHDTIIYALGGGQAVISSRSPELHNAAFAAAGIDAVYLPLPSTDIDSFLAAAEIAGIQGASITVPHKEAILNRLHSISEEALSVGACNTIIRTDHGWHGHNTDTTGFARDLTHFLRRDDLVGLKVTIVGAGGVARAVASVIARLGGKGLIVNRTLSRARNIARKYGFQWASNDERANDLVMEHSDLIINATSVGMEGDAESDRDPLDWYEFSGHEAVYDLIYRPDKTPFLLRAHSVGCRISNGMGMLRYQAAEQFRIWMGREPPSTYLN